MNEQNQLDLATYMNGSISRIMTKALNIATQCNLHCKGCYARSNGIAEDDEANRKTTLTPEQFFGVICM